MPRCHRRSRAARQHVDFFSGAGPDRRTAAGLNFRVGAAETPAEGRCDQRPPCTPGDGAQDARLREVVAARARGSHQMHPSLYAIAPMARPITNNNALRLSLSPINTRPSIPDSPLPRCSHTPARRPKCTTGHRAERHAKTRWVRSQIGSSGHAAEILRVVWAGARGRADGRRNTHVRKTRPDKVPAPFRIQNIPSRPARVQH